MKWLEISLGVVTGIAGFLEIGSLTTAAQAGAVFGYKLVWAVALGVLCLVFLAEQSGRLAAVSGRTMTEAIRERFGSDYFVVLFVVLGIVMVLVCAAELGGVCIAIELLTGVDLRWWAVPAALVAWLLLWKGSFSFIEQGVAALGLVTLAFVVGAIRSHPDWVQVARGFVPSAPDTNSARYWFLVTNILGAAITPYLMFFYSSGAIEDKWDATYLRANRVIAGFGMGFGGFVSLGVLVVAAESLRARDIGVDHYDQLGLLLVEALGRPGFVLVALSLAIAPLSALLEVALAVAYMAGQGLGWNWSQNGPPRRQARFCLSYTAVLLLSTIVILAGVDPIRLTNLSMALTSATLPIAILPFLFVMNDPHYLRDKGNGWLSNAVVLFVIALAFVLAVVTLPLEIVGGG
jgi:Mn2+/Fe2+ NRAMP family transporter